MAEPALAPALTVSSNATALAVKKDQTPLPFRAIDRSFVKVAGGVQNENARMTHFLATDYIEGALHTAPYQRNAFVRWVPQTQELRRGENTVAVLGKVASSRARVEDAGGFSRVTYPATYPNTDERMFIRPDGGMEHDIVLSEAPLGIDGSYSLAYTGRLHMSDGLTLWDDKKQITASHTTRNEIKFKNKLGNTVILLRHPVAFDASVTKADGTLDAEKQNSAAHLKALTGCAYHIDFSESGVTLAILTPGKWLADSGRAYPVTIDPNFGPFGLADGDPPIYTGVAGSDTLIPADTGGVPLIITDTCPGKPDNGYGIIPMPFAFNYYGVLHPLAAPLYVHIDGFASWDQPNVFPLAPNPCNDTDNTQIPSAGYPDNAFFAYWDDLRFSTTPGSGIYFFTDGVAPTRRLVIEWFKMGYSRANNNEVLSFNLVLYECEDKVQFVIGQTNEIERGLATVGIEDPTGALGIQYEFNTALGGALLGNSLGNSQFNPFFNNGGLGGGNNNNGGNAFLGGGGGFGGQGGFGGPGGAGNPQGGGVPNTGATDQPITPGTSIVFQRSALGFLTITSTPRTGCIPHTVCFNATITLPVSSCTVGTTVQNTGGTPATGGSLAGGVGNTPNTTTTGGPNNKSFGFNWVFGDNAEAFTSNVCHTWVTPGVFRALLKITDEFGVSTTLDFLVQVCDVPDVVISASPQGGLAPLIVDLDAFASSPTVTITGNPVWVVDRLTARAEAGLFTTVGSTLGTPVQAHLDTPGIYRVTVTFRGTDTSSGLPTTGTGVVYIFVAAPTDVIEDSLVITESRVTVDWVGKQDGPDPDGLSTSGGGAGNITPGQGFPDRPENDTLFVRGYLSLPGISTSALLGRRVQITLNGVEAVFDGILDAAGKATMNDPVSGRTGEFSIALPSGAFYCNVKRSLYTLLGVADNTEVRMLPAFIGLTVENLYPPPTSPQGALITYDWRSKGTTSLNGLPPNIGQGIGNYRFGSHTLDGFVSGVQNSGRPGGSTLLVSGSFMVIGAKVKLEGKNVYADLTGKLSRYGGDGLRPTDNSDVVVSLGNYSETLNFSSTVGFKVTGKAPNLKFNFKRSKALGKTGIATLQWLNRAGDFRVKTNAIPNELVGLNPALGVQMLMLGLQIQPENDQIFNGAARFELTKKSPTEFVRNTK